MALALAQSGPGSQKRKAPVDETSATNVYKSTPPPWAKFGHPYPPKQDPPDSGSVALATTNESTRATPLSSSLKSSISANGASKSALSNGNGASRSFSPSSSARAKGHVRFAPGPITSGPHFTPAASTSSAASIATAAVKTATPQSTPAANSTDDEEPPRKRLRVPTSIPETLGASAITTLTDELSAREGSGSGSTVHELHAHLRRTLGDRVSLAAAASEDDNSTTTTKGKEKAQQHSEFLRGLSALVKREVEAEWVKRHHDEKDDSKNEKNGMTSNESENEMDKSRGRARTRMTVTANGSSKRHYVTAGTRRRLAEKAALMAEAREAILSRVQEAVRNLEVPGFDTDSVTGSVEIVAQGLRGAIEVEDHVDI